MKRTDTWNTFEGRLAESLRTLEDTQYLILSHPKTCYFVQYAAQAEGALRAEAVSNHHIAPRHRLGNDQELRLIELGWEPPTHQPEADDAEPDGSPNWYHDWESPVDWAAVAKVAVLTLREVYGVTSPRVLQYYGFEPGAGTLVLPSLGLDRERRVKRPELVRVEWLQELKREVERSLLPGLECFAIRRLESGELLTQTPQSLVTVREMENPFQLLLTAHLLHEVETWPKVLEVINRYNSSLTVGRLFASHGAIVLDHAISAEPFVAHHLIGTLALMHELVRKLAGELHEELGGVLTQPESVAD